MRGNYLERGISLPHKPRPSQYEALEGYLDKHAQDEALASKEWSDAQLKVIESFYDQGEIVQQVEVPKPLTKEEKEEDERIALIQLGSKRKLTGPERRKLARLQRRYRQRKRVISN